MTLQYPILFPHGQIGFNENIPVNNTAANAIKREYITKREFFAYQMQTRLAEGMKKIRADLYNNVQDAVMKGDTDAKSIGKRVILPSNLFITITTNPKWDEISDHLKMYGTDDPNDRPDLKARVFKMKLDELISDFNKGIFFPRPKAVVYTIEFQKRGLPHAHILLWLEEPQKFWDHSWQDMAEDVLMHQRRLLRFTDLQLTPNELQHYTLIEIESLLHTFEKSLTEFTGMPLPNKAILDEMKQKAMASHSQFDIAEETMIHHQLFSKLNNWMQDILSVSDKTALTKPFGGKTVLLGGDFRQILPVIPQGTRQETVNVALNRSHLWNNCEIFLLTQNMRVEPEEKAFADWILEVGDGRASGEQDIMAGCETPEDQIFIDPTVLLPITSTPLETLCSSAFPDFANDYKDLNKLRHYKKTQETAILTPTNVTKEYFSADSFAEDEQQSGDLDMSYPVEYLNTLEFPGLPAHKLRLKVGVPVMLLRNLNQKEGL
uniref:ATP-dependent DNA helicase n=1 Tax=Brassica oleracea TaxID=3712 RepID=A0A3P6FDZ8_BRAOL|nr:unnamed protein product [Brassica oleracea]